MDFSDYSQQGKKMLKIQFLNTFRLEGRDHQDDPATPLESKTPDWIGKTLVRPQVNASSTRLMVNPTALGVSN